MQHQLSHVPSPNAGSLPIRDNRPSLKIVVFYSLITYLCIMAIIGIVITLFKYGTLFSGTVNIPCNIHGYSPHLFVMDMNNIMIANGGKRG
jgi:hypothetical protein